MSGKSYTGNSVHKEALPPTEKKFELAELPLHVFDKRSLLSGLLMRAKAMATATYYFEADISRFMYSALEDAIRLVEAAVGGIQLDMRDEVSIFSQHPDHLFVVDALTNIPLLVVKAK